MKVMITMARDDILEECALVAQRHANDVGKNRKPLRAYDPEDQEIIQAEENGEKIAAAIIAGKIRALKSK